MLGSTASCANPNQLGFRVPFIAVSSFAKKSYVSHVIGDHASLLALIEKRFLSGKSLTNRDANANDLEDMFDFTSSGPSVAVDLSKLPAAPSPQSADRRKRQLRAGVFADRYANSDAMMQIAVLPPASLV